VLDEIREAVEQWKNADTTEVEALTRIDYILNRQKDDGEKK
jgi:hypothetical protein